MVVQMAKKALIICTYFWLKSIETIKFLDAQFEVKLNDVYKTETSSTALSENGDPVTVTVTLLSQPTAAVVLRLTGSEISLSAEEIVFSTENWKRPKKEIKFLFNLLENFLVNKIENLHKQNIKLKIIIN